MASASDTERLAREISQWKLAQDLLLLFRKKTEKQCHRSKFDRHRNSQVKTENIFGRWLMMMQFYDWQQLDERYPLFPRQPLDADSKSKAELKRMLEEKLDMTSDQAMELTDELLSMIHQFLTAEHEEAYQPELQYKENEKGGQILVGQFRTLRCHRIKFLVERFGLVSTALVSMRYEPLSQFKGGESGMSVTALNALHDIGQATHEGFASPLNCRLLGRDHVKFCSLFEDTDATFGSMGSFFRIRLSDHPGGWILNPPFVEPVMEETARRVVDLLREAEPGLFWFFIIFPMWDDNDGWQMLNQCEWKVARIDFKESIHQDCYGNLFRPQPAMSVFVLGQLPDEVDLESMLREMDCTDDDMVEKDWLECCTLK